MNPMEFGIRFAAAMRDRENPGGAQILQAGPDMAEAVARFAPPSGSNSIAAHGDFVYVADALPAEGTRPPGLVRPLRYDRGARRLEEAGEPQACQGGAPVYLAAHPSGTLLAATSFRHYGRFTGPGSKSRGSVALLPILPSGALGGMTQRIEYEGGSRHPDRQTASHPHKAAFDPSGRWLCVTDLGTDSVYLHRVADGDAAVAEDFLRLPTPPGSGARHFVFHPNNRFLYVLTEMSCEILTFAFDPVSGACEQLDLQSAKRKGRGGGAADIRMTADGRSLFATVRQGEFMACFGCDPAEGTLTLRGYTETGPNARAIHIEGDFLFGPAPGESTGLGCWRIAGDAEPELLYHRPEIRAPMAYASL